MKTQDGLVAVAFKALAQSGRADQIAPELQRACSPPPKDLIAVVLSRL